MKVRQKLRILPLMVLAALIMSLLTLIPAAAANTCDLEIKGTIRYDLAYKALSLINEERRQMGVDPLVMDKSLMNTAIQRAFEVAVCFDHERPDGRNCFQGFSYRGSCAENLAIGQNSGDSVYSAWKASSAHHNTYISNTYKSTGLVCVVVDNNYLWAQVFDSVSADKLSQPSNGNAVRTVTIAKDYNSRCITVLNWKSDNIYRNFVPTKSPVFASSSVNGHKVTLKWSSATNATGIELFRSNSSGTFTRIKTLSSNSLSYTDTVPDNMTTVRYRIRAYKSVGSITGRTELSSAITIKVTTPKPDQVKFTSASKSKTAIKLKWGAVVCDGYKLYKYDPSTGKYKLIAKIKYGTTQYTVKGLKSGTQYKFVIRAFNISPSGEYVYGNTSRVGKVTTKS